jgi:hypothetical protein
MRLEHNIELSKLGTPRFAVEATEGIGKLFTLATLALNMLETGDKLDIVFHGLNPEDPQRKIASFKEIVNSCASAPVLKMIDGNEGRVSGSSSSYQWLAMERS